MKDLDGYYPFKNLIFYSCNFDKIFNQTYIAAEKRLKKYKKPKSH